MKQVPLWGPLAAPTLRSLTESLRGLNRLVDGPIVVSLNAKGVLVALDVARDLRELRYGRETLPGGGQKFDATASARRLLAALRDLEPT